MFSRKKKSKYEIQKNQVNKQQKKQKLQNSGRKREHNSRPAPVCQKLMLVVSVG